MGIVVPDAFTPKLITALRTGYSLSAFRIDALAGLTVAIVALPLAMALGIASGASPDKGLITAIIAGIVISALGGSRVQIGGPTGAFVVVVFNVIHQHGYDGLVLATLLAGIILLVAGYARIGQFVRFIPYPVVTGFTAGIAVIIATSQIGDLLGLHLPNPPADFIPKWMAYADASDTLSFTALAMGLGALATIIVVRKFAPKAPAYLIAVVAAALAAYFLALDVETIGSRFPAMPTGLTMPELPKFSLDKAREVLPSAFTIAFLAGIEALLSAMVADGMTGFRHRSNQELVGQGAANVLSALFGGLPATGAIARTATNIRAGGRTPVAGIMHAVFLLGFAAFGSDLMRYVPMPVLAAILLMVAWGMSEAERFLQLMKLRSDDRAILLLTFTLTVLVDLTVAIAVGVVIASLLFMNRMSQTTTVAQRTDSDDSEDPEQRLALPADVEVFRISGPLFFGVASQLLDTLRRMGQRPKVLILRLGQMPFLDTTGASALRDLAIECQAKGIQLIFSGTQSQVMKMLSALDLGGNATLVRHTTDYHEALKLAETLR